MHGLPPTIATINIAPGSILGRVLSWQKLQKYRIITITYMNIEPSSSARSRRLRERRSRGIAMVAPVEGGEGGIKLLVSNGLLKQHQVADRKAVGEACLAALEQLATGRGARTLERCTESR